MSLLRQHATDDEQSNEVARPGDLVIVQEQYNTLKPVTLIVHNFFDNRYGRFAHDEILGQPLGRRQYSLTSSAGRQSCAGFVHVLKPTPELWSQAMDHRTQIVYPHDAALISLLLDLRPGSVLVESGTGSGSASAAFARVVAPGTIYSFDFHKERALAAERDFQQLGIDHIVKVRGGVDVLHDGFTGVDDSIADAVFLDLPVPYEMADEVNRVLRKDGSICIFSPCIEQVQRSCTMLRSSGFHSIRTVTAPVKTYETREMVTETPGFDDLSSNTMCDREPPCKRMRSDDDGKVLSEKNMRFRNRTAGAERMAISALDGDDRHLGRVIRPSIRLHSRPFGSMKGHTSYLTFARKCIVSASSPGTRINGTSAVLTSETIAKKSDKKDEQSCTFQ